VAVLRDGAPEQVGTPREVYREPGTEFVAGFVGDNNVFSGAVRSVRDGVAVVDVDGEPLSIAVDDAVRSGDTCTFCVRPEDLTLEGAENTLSGPVRSAEFLGDTTRVHVAWNGRELLVRTADPPSGSVTVGFDPDAAHVVDRS
jgi:thiamine transport system ATP-binding protein